ncbi:response regulator [Brucella sp. 21LCYQ03]|nr:response regulator [Brucella sp. 21LCYQ03]
MEISPQTGSVLSGNQQTDVGLPGMSGIELAQKVNEKWPDVSIIFTSGNNNAKANSGLANAFQVSKPFMMEQLRAVLTQANLTN